MKRRREFSKEEEEEAIPTLDPCGSLLRTICFWGYRDKYRTEIDWFVVKVSINLQKQQVTRKVRELAAFDNIHLHAQINKEKEEEPILPVFSFHKKEEGGAVPLWGNSFATLGPYIYSLGGSFYYRTELYGSLHTSPKKHRNRSNLVHYFDITNTRAGWIKAPSMITPRITPQVIPLNRKLYVFGCSKGPRKCRHNPTCLVWAEVFDPSLGLWTALPDPPFLKTLVICSPSHLENKILALVDKRHVYELDTQTNRWTCKFKFRTAWKGNITHQPVLVGDLLYWFDADIHAYDIQKDKLYRGPVQDFSFQRSMRMRPTILEDTVGQYRPAIFHLGGCYFCLLAFDYGNNYRGCCQLRSWEKREIHCLTIKVSTTNECYKRYGMPGMDIGGLFLRAAVLSCQSFPIDDRWIFLDGRFIVV